LIGGYAEHVRPLLFRLSPRSLVDEGLTWRNMMAFNERYGRIETVVREKEDKDGGGDNRGSRGSSRTRTKHVRPGIMPTLFGRPLIGNSVFLSLSEVADNLPLLNEEVHALPLDADLAGPYRAMEKELTAAIKEMMSRSHGKDKRLLGTMLNVLLAYPDYPYDWGPIGYYQSGGEDGEGGGWV